MRGAALFCRLFREWMTAQQRSSGGAKGIPLEEHPKGRDRQEWQALKWQQTWYIHGTVRSQCGWGQVGKSRCLEADDEGRKSPPIRLCWTPSAVVMMLAVTQQNGEPERVFIKRLTLFNL